MIRDRQTPFTPYELYSLRLSTIPKVLDVQKEIYEAHRLNSVEKDAEAGYLITLQMHMSSMIKRRDAFLKYARQDKLLSAEQVKILQEIRKHSFPILKEKAMEELTAVEFVQSMRDESSTIGPLVKKFMDEMKATGRKMDWVVE